jgi:menaquinol-cytochrome c reductase iron-sulfur subunit
MAPVDDRRSFLRWATHGLSAVFTAILGVPAVMYLIHPRNVRGGSSELRVVDGIRVSEALEAQRPLQGVIRDLRVDGWTLHPDDVIGRVWVVRDPQAEGGLRVFTTICPHLGCSVNLSEQCFACPCHNARFNFAGDRLMPNPALRGMDTLEWQRDPSDSERLLVRYRNFEAAVAEKKPIG